MSKENASVKTKPYWRWLRDLVIVIAVVLLVQWWQSRDMPRGEAPSLAGASLTGEPVSLAQYRGKPVLVHFWATWCPICRLEEDSIASIAEDHPVIAVATNSGTSEEIAAYLQEQGITLPVLMDEAGDQARNWGVVGIPASFIVDSKGNITYATAGYSSEWGLRARIALAD